MFNVNKNSNNTRATRQLCHSKTVSKENEAIGVVLVPISRNLRFSFLHISFMVLLWTLKIILFTEIYTSLNKVKKIKLLNIFF